MTEDFSYLVACIYYLAVYLTDSADWGIPLTASTASNSTVRAATVVSGEEEDKIKLNTTQRQQIHFQAVLDNIEVTVLVVPMIG